MDAVLFSRKSDEWTTPEATYVGLDAEFHFTDDPCPLGATDGLEREWKGSVYVNPPYSKIAAFVEKAIQELDEGHAHTVVFLVPSRTDTRWFHRYVLGRGGEIRFIKGRLKFSGSKNSAPFPSMIVIWRDRKMGIPDYEERLDEVFTGAFTTNHPAMIDWVQVKMELKRLRNNRRE
ncbi:MAG: N-6-adenine-methyltransferase protein [Microgenomates group bacterium GW2011_GWF1_38_5]|nr:MAG: N-6-adenine-methyltransferase protein [Microgenomates group bacterium GW2011_GWF1_38_5]